MSAPAGFTALEVRDSVDKLSVNLAHVRAQLTAIQTILEDTSDPDADVGFSLSLTASHFVGLLQDDLDALTKAVEQRTEA